MASRRARQQLVSSLLGGQGCQSERWTTSLSSLTQGLWTCAASPNDGNGQQGRVTGVQARIGAVLTPLVNSDGTSTAQATPFMSLLFGQSRLRHVQTPNPGLLYKSMQEQKPRRMISETSNDHIVGEDRKILQMQRGDLAPSVSVSWEELMSKTKNEMKFQVCKCACGVLARVTLGRAV